MARTHETESMSTSPPKYRDKSQKWVPCSMTGPISMALFHHAGLAMASYAQDCIVSIGLPIPCRRLRAYVSCIGSHDGQVVLVDDLLHLLDAAEVSQHVTDRDNVAVLDQGVGDGLGGLDGSGSDGLYSQLRRRR